MAKITIKGAAVTKNDVSKRTGKPYTMTTQQAVFETENAKGVIELNCADDGHDALPIGSEWHWDVEADMRAGRFGPEFPRKLTLTEVRKSAAKAA
jgi:hypothetical protein